LEPRGLLGLVRITLRLRGLSGANPNYRTINFLFRAEVSKGDFRIGPGSAG